MALITLHQSTTFLTDPVLYRVKNEVTVASGISPAVFVFRTSDETFSHYAAVADLIQLPTDADSAIADGLGFYRQAEVTRDWDTVDEMNCDLADSKARIQLLVKEWAATNSGAAIDQTINISSEA